MQKVFLYYELIFKSSLNIIIAARAMGMRLGDAITPFGKVSRDYKQILQHLQELKDNKQCELVIVIFPDFDSDIYGKHENMARE